MKDPESEQSLRLVARSFSAVGHELAGPLQTTLNALFVLERKKALVPPELLSSLRALESSVETLRARLERVLQLPRALHSFRQDTTGPDVIERALEPLGPEAPRVHCEVGAGGRVRIDGEAAALALTELLLNALQATPGGEIFLAVSSEETALVARVTNASTAAPPRAFAPFSRSEGKTLALGLPIAKAVALSHGGALELEHQAGLVVTTLTLPGGPR